MHTEQTTLYTTPAVEEVVYKDVGPSPHVEHDTEVERSYVVPGYAWYYEWITPNSGHGSGWKSFQHYRREARDTGGFTTQALRLGTPAFAPSSTAHVHRGDHFAVIRGYQLYNNVGGSSVPFGEPGMLNSGLPVYYEEGAGGKYILPPAGPAGLNALIQRSLDAMLPKIKAEVSLLNSIYELKDFKSLPGLVRDYGSLRSIAQLAPYKALGKILRLGAQTQLQYEFAFAPLVSDIVGIYQAVSRHERKMNAFISRAGRRQRKHFTVSWPEHIYDDAETSETGWALDTFFGTFPQTEDFRCIRYVDSSPTVFHAEIEYNFNYTQYQVQHAAVLSLLDALGVNLNPAIIWNAIPWSFVVDWVISVGKYLDNFKRDFTEPQINITRYLWSAKRRRTITVAKISKPLGPYGSLPQTVYMPAVEETAYRRDVGLPAMSSIELSGLTAKQVSLGAALVVAQRRRRTKRGIR